MRTSAVALSSLLAAAVAPLAAAQPSVDVRALRASIDPASGVHVEPAATPATGEWNASLWTSYAHRPIVLRDTASGEVRFEVVRHQLTADLAAGVGVARRLLVGFTLPVLLHQNGDAPTAEATRVLGDAPLPAQALGDLGLIGKLTLVRPTGGDFGGFALALHERFSLPTGDEASTLGEGSVTSESRLLAEYRLVAFGVHLAAGVLLRADEARFACEAAPIDAARGDTCATRFGHELPFGLGLSFRPQLLGIDEEGRSTLFLEANGHLPLSPVAPFEAEEVAAASLGLGARYALRDVSLLAGVETALMGGIGTAPVRATLSVAWVPRVHDVDSDGIDDEVDRCRELAEDHDGFEDDDGCPEGDNDDDGVTDDEDRCPAHKEDEDGFEDDDGCPDVDNDRDHLPDAADACPNEAGPASADQGKSGCPARDVDGDGDGIPDVADACPAAAGVDRPDPKEKGCPAPEPLQDGGALP